VSAGAGVRESQSCLNNGGNTDQSGESRNPNDKILSEYAIGLIDETLARVTKVGVCHWSEDEEIYVYLSLPEKRAKGHEKNHEEDVFGLDREACEALNEAE
jgi:hypothetical protein